MISKFISQHKTFLEVFSNAYSISRALKDIYTELSRLVTGSNVGVLEGDAENIVDFIVGSLRKLTSTIEVKVSIAIILILILVDITKYNIIFIHSRDLFHF